MTESQKEALVKLAAALDGCIPYLYNTIGGENIKCLTEALSEINSVMRE